MPEQKLYFWYNWKKREMVESDGDSAGGTSWHDVPEGEKVHLHPHVERTSARKADREHLIVSGPGADDVCHGEGEKIESPAVDIPMRKLRMTSF